MRSPKVRISKLLDNDTPVSRPANVTVSLHCTMEKHGGPTLWRPAVSPTWRMFFPFDGARHAFSPGRAPPSRPPVRYTDVIGPSLSFPRGVVSRLFQVLATYLTSHYITMLLLYLTVMNGCCR